MPDDNLNAGESEGSVVDEILTVFLNRLEAEPEMTGVGERLRKALMDVRDDSEAVLRAAILGAHAT